ncbi:ComEC/Rec2 family competence protein [soil metagenome]
MDEGGGDQTVGHPDGVGLSAKRRRWRFVPPGAGRALVERAAFRRTQLAAVFAREIDAGRGFLWLPVAFGLGIVIYFALPAEPWAPALAGLALVLGVGAWRAHLRTVAFRMLVLATMVAAGVLVAKVRTDNVAAPMLARELTATVTGWVAAREEAARGGARIRLRVHEIAELKGGPLPTTVRITVRSGAAALGVGDAVSLRARLQPPSGPVMPGGYDFAQAAFFEGVGAVGFAYGAAKPADLGPAPLDIRLAEPLARLRDLIRRRIEAALPGDHGHVAAALVMGDQGGIAESTQDAMRASGLGHLLSISGLHMALVAGSAFWLIRALLALSTALALNRPIKKWAAGAALAVAAIYLGISGGGVATQRSFVMLAIMLLAVIADRHAITLRNVALATLVILLFTPESVVTASFQMSFAATAALVAGYEAIAARADRRAALTTFSDRGVLGRLRSSFPGVLLTSLIAGLATAPFGIYHFQRVAPPTLLANIAAMPVVGIFVMPMALAAVVLMPFGLESLPLTVMGWGLAWVDVVAPRTAEWSSGYGGVPAIPALSLVLFVIGFLWLILWRERWRLLGLAPMILAIPLAAFSARPDIFVDERGVAVAVRGADGRLAMVNGKGATFEVENWLRADADPRAAGARDLAAGVACDGLGCVAPLGAGDALAVVTGRAAGFDDDCRRAAVVVSRLPAPPGCSSLAIVIDRDRLARFGAHALYGTGTDAKGKPKFRVTTAYPAARRPFMPPAPAEHAEEVADDQ